MSAGTLNIRRLSVEEIQGLSTLFREERDPSNPLDFWQERGEKFLQIYAHHMSGEPVFWGAFSDGKLLGVTGTVPTLSNNPFSDHKGSLHTDFFVSPQSRSRSAAVKLIIAFKDWMVEQRQDPPIFFGVEHNLNALEACNLIAERSACTFIFPLQSQLTQVFLTSKPSFQISSEVKIAKLKELSVSIREQWQSLYTQSREPNFLSPRLQTDTFDKMTWLDPDCECLWIESHGEIVAGTLLLDPTRARKFLWSGKSNLVIARLAKAHQIPIVPGSEIKIGLVSLSIGEGLKLRQVFESTVQRAWDRKLQALAFRDEAAELLTKLSLDQFQFPRRVFYVHGPEFKARHDLLRAIQQNQLKVRLETTFL